MSILRHIYSLGIHGYRQLVKVAALRNRKAALLLVGEAATLDLLAQQLDKQGGYIWFHAASLGEFEQGRPVMEQYRANHPDCKILLTFFSPSGYEVRKDYAGADVVAYLPFDTPSRVERFLDLVKPKVAIFIKYEFWANYLTQIADRGIPLFIISALFRPEQFFFKWYGGFFRQMLQRFTTIFVQNEASKVLLASCGIDHVVVAGDTRFDRVLAIQREAKELPIIERFTASGQTLIAGSSWGADEELLIHYFNLHPHLRLIVAPHEIDEAHLTQIESRLQRPALRYSKATPEEVAGADCLIIDCFGILSSLYRYGTIAYIGGGFGVGIHNITEAAVYGMPILFGTNYHKFREAHELLACGGAISISCQSELDLQLDRLLSDPHHLDHCGKCAGAYIAQQAGATTTILQEIEKSLNL